MFPSFFFVAEVFLLVYVYHISNDTPNICQLCLGEEQSSKYAPYEHNISVFHDSDATNVPTYQISSKNSHTHDRKIGDFVCSISHE